ncbi:MAG: Resolvase, N-terminal domain [Geminicoccaceae bacterium]|nr:Resolvase, N-terminal domain [Geminicoccaceae bacterium]
MAAPDLLPAAVLRRKAVVYVRQSTPVQVQVNAESRRRQYELVEVARRRGFREVEVIDDDLGRSAGGTVERPGFERLVAWLCAGEVGAVLCLEASRLARNGRDWHHLLELCGLVEARVIDLDGVYDPCRPNDRLLLGMKGSISEFELGVLRARMLDAARAKARRGELRIAVPIGYSWHREAGLGLDPDLRVQEAVRLIFARFRELGSARQVLLSMTADQVHFPRPSDGKKLITFDLRLAAGPVPQRGRRAEEPLLRGGVRLRQKREAHRYRRRPCPQELRARQAAGAVGGAAQGPPRGLHRLGDVPAEPGAARGERVQEGWRREVGTRRTGVAGRPPDLRLLWPPAAGILLGQGAGTARLSLRSAQPDAGAAAVPDVRRGSHRRCDRRRAAARLGTDGDRGGAGSGADTGRESDRTPSHRRAGAAAGALRGEPRGAALRGLRSRQPPHRRPVREELGGGAPPRGSVRGPRRGRADVGPDRRDARPRRSRRRSGGRLEHARHDHAHPPAAGAPRPRRRWR